MIRFLAALCCVCSLAAPASAQNFLEGVVSINVNITKEDSCIASQGSAMANGRRTASGERFNKYATAPYTLAHKTRRMGSMVTVTNPANGRSIRAKVTDRGPHVRGRCVDLGRAGADGLRMGGTARVTVP